MNLNKVLWNEISNDFRAAMAILPSSSLRVPCVECRGCSLRILNPNEMRISKHREACPHRFQFKYVYPTIAGERLTVKCLLCFESINSTAMAVLMCHRRSCMPLPPQQSTSGPEPQIYYLSTDELFNSGETNTEMDEPNPNANDVSTHMEVSNNENSVEAENSNEVGSTVSTPSTQKRGNDSFKIRTWDTEAGKFDFRIVRVRDENGTVKRCMQCLICSRVIRTVGRARVISHRNVCFRKTLVTTMTTPYDRDTNKSNDEFPEVKRCFICDASVEIHPNSEKRDHVNLYNTNTSHSDTPIYDLVWKFLGEKPSHRNLTTADADSQWNCVCLNCFQNIEDYDFATSESQRLEKVLMEKLSITEKAYEEQSNDETVAADENAEMTETDDDIEIIEADRIVELIISDDECDEIEESSQTHQTIVQSSETVDPTPQPTQKEEEVDEIIDLNSDDDEVELVETPIPDSWIEPAERVLTFNEL